MAASKINKIKRIGEPKHTPRTPYVTNIKNPDTFNSSSPSWCFRLCDRECWTLTAGDLNEILPKLKDWEAQTWNEILVKANKQNHSIDAANLNKLARERLDTMRIEAEAIVSLRLQGTHRLYTVTEQAACFIFYGTIKIMVITIHVFVDRIKKERKV